MSRFVYCLPSPTTFVYRKMKYMLHKPVCGCQNSHKLACGLNFGFYHPQAPSSRPHREPIIASIEAVTNSKGGKA
jgi:hypothetical protein